MPQSQISTGGSIERALSAASPNERDASLKAFQADIYARSNTGPHVSRMRTWNRLAAAWSMQPLPLTVELVQAVGASFKKGGYRSAQLYYSTARKNHILHHGRVPAEVDISIQDAIRSIEWGQGPGKLKDGFSLSEVGTINLDNANDTLKMHYYMVVLGCHFLTREIELSATLLRHLQVDAQKQIVTWTLPSSKTDTRGELIARSHKCLCHVANPMICPFHCAADLMAMRMRTHNHDDSPLFPDPKAPRLKKINRSIDFFPKSIFD